MEYLKSSHYIFLRSCNLSIQVKYRLKIMLLLHTMINNDDIRMNNSFILISIKEYEIHLILL